MHGGDRHCLRSMPHGLLREVSQPRKIANAGVAGAAKRVKLHGEAPSARLAQRFRNREAAPRCDGEHNILAGKFEMVVAMFQDRRNPRAP